MNILIPLWVALQLLGSSLGLSYEQTHADTYVAYSVTSDASAGGMACNREWMAPVEERFTLACTALLRVVPKVAIIFTTRWPMDPNVQAYLIRHEVEHILLGPGPDNAWTQADEVPAIAAGCAVARVDLCS